MVASFCEISFSFSAKKLKKKKKFLFHCISNICYHVAQALAHDAKENGETYLVVRRMPLSFLSHCSVGYYFGIKREGFLCCVPQLLDPKNKNKKYG